MKPTEANPLPFLNYVLFFLGIDTLILLCYDVIGCFVKLLMLSTFGQGPKSNSIGPS
jgi:hypothetical protein